MDRISDSGSDGCGSIPHGGTKRGFGPFLCTWSTPSHCVTAPVGHTDRSLSLWSGAVAGSMFFKHLPDASGTALKRLLSFGPFLCICGVIYTIDPASGSIPYAIKGRSAVSGSNGSRPGI